MKKSLRVFLFAALLICLCGVTTLCAVAADNYEVRNNSDALVGKYETLSSAIGAVAGNNYTVNVLADATEPATVALNKAYTYTINGNGHTISSAITDNMLTVSTGTVTLRNVTLARQNTSGYVLYISGAAANVTLDGAVITGGSNQMYMSAAGTLNVQGASSLGVGCGSRIMHLTNGSRGGSVNLRGGTYVDGPYAGFSASGARIVVTGGTFTASNTAMFFQMDNDYISPVIISAGTFTASNGASVIRSERTGDEFGTVSNKYSYGNDIVRISGGTFNVTAGSRAITTSVTVPLDSRADGAISGRPTIAISGGTFTGTDDAHSLLYAVSSKLATGTPCYRVTGGTFSGALAWIRSSGSEIFYIGTPGNNTTPSFYGNTSAAARFVWFHNASQNGRIEIDGGRFEVASDNYMFNAAGADIVIRGGSFTHAGLGIYMGDGDCVSNVTVSGGTFHATGTQATLSFTAVEKPKNAKKGYLEISGGDFTADNGTSIVVYSTTQIGTHCTISGGTFHGDGKTVLIEGHSDVRSLLSITGGTFAEDITRYVLGHGSSGVSKNVIGGVTHYTVNSAEFTPFCGSQLALSQNLSLYLYFVLPDATANKALTLTVTAGNTETVVDTYSKSITYPNGTPVATGYTLVRFVYAGIAPQRIGDTITAVLKANGSVAANMGAYSVLNYCNTLLSTPGAAETKALVANLLNYGAAAQAYTGYRNTEPVNTLEGVSTYATAYEPVSAPIANFTGDEANGYGLTRCGLRFDSVNRLYVRLSAPVPEAVRVTYSIGGGTPQVAVLRDGGDGGYIAYTEGLNLTDFGSTVIFTLQDADAGDGISVPLMRCTYSVLSFIAAWQDDADVTGDLAKTLGAYYQASRSYLTPFTPVLRFVAVSDIHFMTSGDSSSTTTVMPTQAHDVQRCFDRLTAFFTRPYEYAAGENYNTVDAFMIVGDNTDDGTAKQVNDFLAIAKNNINSEQTRLLIVNGNHEYYDTGESNAAYNNHTKTDNRLTSALSASGLTNYNGLQFHTTINGYHFIGFSPTDKGGRAFSDDMAAWLDGEIAAAVAANTAAGHPNNPVFVCQHQQVHSTVNGSPDSSHTYSQENIRAVLAKYQQVVDFAGHSHSAIDHPRSVWQGEFTALTTGTLSYAGGYANTRGGTYASGHGDPYNEHNEKETAEYTVVEIDANNRMRLRYFFLSREDNSTPLFIGERMINVGDKSTFNWGKLQQISWTLPRFTEGQELTRYEVETPTSLQIRIPQATCNAVINNYRCELYQNGSLVKTVSRRGGQFVHPYNECVVPFTGLTPATEYTVKVFPVSTTGAVGDPLVGTFTTGAQADVFTPDIFSAQFNADGSVKNAVNGDVLVKNGSAAATLGSATFTGEGDYQWRGIEAYYELMQTSLTFETYARVTSASRGKFIVGNFEYHIPTEALSRTQVHGGFGFKVESNGKLSFYLLTSDTTISWHNITAANLLNHAVTTSTAYDDGTLVHMVGTYDGTTIKFYVNGALVGTLERAGVMDYPLKSTTQYLSLGGDSGIDYASRDFMTGEIRKVSLYSTAMTADQVSTLYANRNETPTPPEWGALQNIPNADNGFVPVIRFAVTSDVHGRVQGYDSATMLEVDTQTRRTANLFRHTYQYAEMSAYHGVDAVMIVGDYTDYGRAEQYDAMMSLINAEIKDGTELLVCLGNHEFWEPGENGGSSTTTTKTYARFEEYFGHAPDSHNVIGGFHFIGISPDCNGGRNYSAAKAEWLANELAIAAAADPTGLKPIFIYQHISPANSVYGSSKTTDPNAAYAAITVGNVAKLYPQAVVLAGHSHRPTNDPASISQTDFTTLNTGTMAYGCYEIYTDNGVVTALPKDDRGGMFLSSMGDAKNEHGLRESSIFMIVEVDAAGHVRIQYIDADAHCRVGEPIIIDSIGQKANFTFTSARAASSEAPYFAGGSEISLVSALPNSLRLSFPQAISRDTVRNYKVEVYRGETLVDKFYRLSNVYFPPVPPTLLAPCVGLEPAATYQIKIYAYNTWGVISPVPLTGSFTTPAADPELTPDLFSLAFRKNGTAYDAISGGELLQTGSADTVYEGSLGRYVGVFDGNGDYQWRDIERQYELMAGSFTFEILVLADNAPASGYYDLCSNQQTGGFGFEYKTNGKVYFYVHSEATSGWITPGATLPVGQYVHLVGTCDGEAVRIYLNGELIDTAAIDGHAFFPLQPGAQYLSIGGDSGSNFTSTNIFNGRVAVTNLYSAALTAEQVAALAKQYPQKILDVQFKTNGTAVDRVSGEELVKHGTVGIAADEELGRYVGVFTGAGDYQWRDIGNYYDALESSLTLETYLKVDQFVTSGYVDLVSSQHQGGMGFELKANNQLYFLVYNGSSYDRVGPFTVPVGQYVHLVVTYDGSVFTFYADGKSVGTLERTLPIVFQTVDGAKYLSIGGDASDNYNSNGYMTGSIASVSLYAEALSAEQVTMLYVNRNN